MQAFGGIMSVVGEEGRPPVRVAPSIVDQGTALWGVIASSRRCTAGAIPASAVVVDVSLFETALPGW